MRIVVVGTRELDMNQLWVTGEVQLSGTVRVELVDTEEPGVRLLFRWMRAGVREAGDILGEVHKPEEVGNILQEYGLR